MPQEQFSETEIQFLIDVLPRFKSYVRKTIGGSSQKDMSSKIIKITKDYLEYKITPEEKRSLDIQKHLRLSKYRMNNYFKINESGGETEVFYEADDLAGYTRKIWESHRKLTREDFIRGGETEGVELEDRVSEIYGRDYDKLYMSGTWCSWLEDEDTIVYANLCSLESYCQDLIESKVMKEVDALIPNKIVYDCSGAFDDEGSGGSGCLDMELRAGGREDEYNRLMSRIPNFEKSFADSIVPIVSEKLEGMVFKAERGDGTMILVVPGLSTAAQIKTKSFLRSVYELEQPFSLLEKSLQSAFEECGFRERLMELYEENRKL